MTQLSMHSLSNLEGASFVWQMSLDPWLGCEEYAEREWALELNGRQASSSEEKEEGEKNPPPSHANGSSISFMETYPHFPAWQYEVMNPNGSYSSVTLDRLEHTPNVPWPDLITDSKNLDFMQVMRETLRVAPLEDPEDHVFRFKTAELCPTIEEFFAILGYDPSKKFIAVSCDPKHWESLSDTLGLPTSITSSMVEGHMVDRLLRQSQYEQGMPGGKGRKPFTPMDTNLTSIKNMLLGLEMADWVNHYFVKVYFHKMTTEYSNWLVDKISNKEANMVAMRKQFLKDNRERCDDDNYEFKMRDKCGIVSSTEEINDLPKEKRLKTK
ncbi:hypothetical protein SO802_009758 [Lithocarpus litseifolius]|uniref:Uncharacterized protein n=1 Tax=Lithocarpus litseifolius TaxID=425828 RepID=A0AAW2DHX2_9ROSI